ncbi:flagellar biosynthesis protein FlhF [Siminovitchia sediminis]|uniref:Flagellar biosynthesis protein FlhF n=1 Tax=Siminovitchia sediminis TaxID=1274353 RepID=A0ABW4KCI0_9BACI
MSIKKIMAPTMPEAFQKVKDEVGEDAVILSSRVVWTKGVLGFFKKKQFEVVAALDNQHDLGKKQALPNFHEEQSTPGIIEKIQESQVLSELAELKKLVAKESPPSPSYLTSYPEPVQQTVKMLLEQEVDHSHAMKIGDQLLARWRQSKEEPTIKDMVEEAKSILSSQLNRIGFTKDDHKKFIALVGPTGVGKTTTLAKMAAHAALEQEKKVAFITLDTYRIAAIEQLKTYAGLLNVPVKVAYEAEDFVEAAKGFSDYDHIFIDTAGRNYRDKDFVNELNQMLKLEEELDIYLVLSVTMKERDLAPILDNFQQLQVSRLIFSKVDETNVFGSMLNIMWDYQLAAAYVTTGQEVPDDIVQADPPLFINYLLGDGKE